jgi:AraC family transcriptional regulator
MFLLRMPPRHRPFASDIPFRDARSGRAVDAFNRAELAVSSRSLGWTGVTVEAGTIGGWDLDEIAVAHHYVGLNAGTGPVPFEAKIGSSFRKLMMPPGGVWFCPAGNAFTHRVPGPTRFAVVAIAPERLDALAPLDRRSLRTIYDVRSPQLGRLIRGLVDEAAGGGSSGQLFVDALATALGLQIGQAVASTDGARTGSRGLGPRQLARVLELIETRLATGVSVVELAAAATLSVSRFTHAFREAVGTSPHQYLMARRLERAREELQGGGSTIVATALKWGFTDQSHFTRLFRRRFGETPGRSLR